MLQELFEDGVSAAVGDVGVVKYYIKQHPEKQFKLVPDAKFERQYFGIAVAKGNSELLGKINAGLQRSLLTGLTPKSIKPGSTTTCRRCQRNNPPFSVTTAIAQAIAVFLGRTMTGFRWEIIEEYGPLFMDGALMTIKCTIICVILGTLWGLTSSVSGGWRRPSTGRGNIFSATWCSFGALYVSAFRGTPLFVQIMVVHFALVPLFINPRDGLLVTSGLMSADFARELRASYGRSSPASWRSPLTPEPMCRRFSAPASSRTTKGRWRPPARWACRGGKPCAR